MNTPTDPDQIDPDLPPRLREAVQKFADIVEGTDPMYALFGLTAALGGLFEMIENCPEPMPTKLKILQLTLKEAAPQIFGSILHIAKLEEEAQKTASDLTH
jgi:hypothetical protein